MDKNQKITYGILGVLSLIVAALGGNVYLTPDQLEKAYVCTTNQYVGVFDSLSSTTKTGYYVDELGVNKSAVCKNGFWIPIRQYAKDNDIEINVLLTKIYQLEVGGEVKSRELGESIDYLCDVEKCVSVSKPPEEPEPVEIEIVE